jgi:short-subunit dehydrogenase
MKKKAVIITGVSSGIGRETALFLAKHNYVVYGGARRVEKLKELEQKGVNTFSLDVTDEISVSNFVGKVLENEGRIDVLINNAGYGEYGSVEDVEIENAKKQIDVNLFGLARMIKLVLPVMRKQQSGKIVNISSIGGKMATPMGGWYHASKFAVEALSDSLRMEVKQFGIDVIVVEPGGIKSEWVGIANQTMLAASGNTAYAHLAEKAPQSTETIKKMENKIPAPTVIAELIRKAIEAKNPKTRYSKGFLAKPILLLKKYTGDKLFDKIILSQFK